MRYPKRTIFVAAIATTAFLLSSCAGLTMWGQSLNRALNGVSATITTYDQYGHQIDQVHGKSINFSRDKRFDGKNSDGSSKNDSQVMLISIGKDHMEHVGSTLILAQDGLTQVANAPTQVELNNSQSGHPWLNDFYEYNRNLWRGKAKTILIRSQNGNPIAVFAGNEVEIAKTDVPQSTWFNVDNKTLFVYRADYTVYDTDLLG